MMISGPKYFTLLTKGWCEYELQLTEQPESAGSHG